ncbi:hypothetical protein [Roseovarius sp. 2305UL8-3]|uniref:hypothetical protein n=1 Tax=Roseovarius conchicola TaxID=3121636 RepID=UPI00352981BE
MKLDWKKYATYQLPDFPFGELARTLDIQEVEHGLETLKSQLQVRQDKLQELVRPAGILLDGSDKEIIKLNELFSGKAERQPGADHMTFAWGEFCLDVGVYLGETIRKMHPKLSWDVLERGDPEHPEYHDIGLIYANELYVTVDVFNSIFMYAQSVLDNDLLWPALWSENFLLIVQQTDARMRGEDPFEWMRG